MLEVVLVAGSAETPRHARHALDGAVALQRQLGPHAGAGVVHDRPRIDPP